MTDAVHVAKQRFPRIHRDLRWLVAVLRAMGSLSRRKQIHFLAASIAYYAFAALIPLLLFAFIGISVFGGQDFASHIIVGTQGYLTPATQELLHDAIVQTEGRTGVIFGASLVFVWSVFRLLQSLDIAISMVYETELSPPLLTQIASAAMLFFALVIAASGLISIITFFAVFPGIPLIGIVSAGAVLVALVPVFWAIYFLLPAVDHSVVDALPGAIVAAVSWILLNTLFGIYTAAAGQYQVYGLLGGVLLLFVWFYVCGMILVFGAVINAVLYGQTHQSERSEKSSTSI